MTYSEPELEFTFAKNENEYLLYLSLYYLLIFRLFINDKFSLFEVNTSHN